MRTALTRLAQLIAGTVCGLMIAEGAFWVRDDGAFPHVNFYQEDPDWGVRLRPHASQYIAFGGNPTTSIATNSLGYRTPEWPDGDGGILVVGDSQVFGLGVEEQNTTPAQLARETGEVVLNGGVPTYGPAEYLAVVSEVAQARKLDTVVVVFNFSNDLFEVGYPNRDRHRVWDGWAVRAETAPNGVIAFPGRGWLYSRSHAFFALRSWLHTPTAALSLGLPSEGTVDDVLGAAALSEQERHKREEQIWERRKPQQEAYLKALDELGDHDDLEETYLLLGLGYADNEDLKLQAVKRGASVGDIVRTEYAESSRHITVTASILQEGAQIRGEIRQRLFAVMREDPNGYDGQTIRAALRAGFEIDPSLAVDAVDLPWKSPLDGPLDRLAKLAEVHGFTPVVVALPLDVQVLPSQFEKYGAAPKDMTESRVLLHELAEAARRRGIRVAEPLLPLAAVGDEAFLDRDLHLSAAGHEAVAKTIAKTIAGPAPVRPPTRAITERRSLIPWVPEWLGTREIRVTGSTRNHCETRQIREWFRMDCAGPIGLRIVDAPLEAHGWHTKGAAVLVTPMLEGRDVLVDVIWEDRTERLNMSWKADGSVTRAFERADMAGPQDGTEVATHSLDFLYPESEEDERATWIGAGAECEIELTLPQCLQGKRDAMPSCPTGFANAGSAGHCFALCNDQTPCNHGVCTPWSGSAVCL